MDVERGLLRQRGRRRRAHGDEARGPHFVSCPPCSCRQSGPETAGTPICTVPLS